MTGKPILITTCVLLLCGFGCAVERPEFNDKAWTMDVRHHPYEEVKARAKLLDPGMGRIEVVEMLGWPTVREGDTWVYTPQNAPELLPTESLRVLFSQGVYIGHHLHTVTPGERWGGH